MHYDSVNRPVFPKLLELWKHLQNKKNIGSTMMAYTNFWEHSLVSSREQFEEHSRHLGIFGSTFGPGSTY